MRKFWAHEWAAIKSDFKEHPVFAFIQYSGILLVFGVALYVLFNEEHHTGSVCLLLIVIFLLSNKIKNLKHEISYQKQRIQELEQKNRSTRS